jgi:hypothetical protein
MTNFTSFTLDDCLSECNLRALGARELEDLCVLCIPEAYGVGSDTVEVVQIFPMMAGVIEKARRNNAFRSILVGFWPHK